MKRNEALEEVRKRMQKKSGGFTKDPMQFAPKQVKEGETAKYKFYVLPPLEHGDACVTGKASKSMDLWYITAGTHWINRRPFECPRQHDGGDCPYCSLGFELLKDCDDPESRQNIVKNYLSRSNHVVNIYFPPFESNPPELRGKVMWYQLPKAAYDAMEKTIMRDDSSDDSDDPVASGLFYDPENAYVFQLEVGHKGGYNEYSASKFLVKSKGPMIKNKDGAADFTAIEKVLNARHDLYIKYAPRDAAALQAKVDEVLRGKNGDTDDESEEAITPSKPVQTRSTQNEKTNNEMADRLIDELPVATSKPTQPTAQQTKSVKAQSSDDISDDELDKLLKEIS
jgi:hypothetical protein